MILRPDPYTLGHLTKLAINILIELKGFKFVQMKRRAVIPGDII